MSEDITGLCKDHSFESAEAVCRRCGLEFCELCLVYPFGANRPLCKECAMAEGGVRSHVSRAPMGRREIRKKVKAFNARLDRAAAKTTGTSEINTILRDPLAPTEEDLERVPAVAPAPAADHTVAEAQAVTYDAPPPQPPPPPAEDPADGVAPPIDWNQPFG